MYEVVFEMNTLYHYNLTYDMLHSKLADLKLNLSVNFTTEEEKCQQSELPVSLLVKYLLKYGPICQIVPGNFHV